MQFYLDSGKLCLYLCITNSLNLIKMEASDLKAVEKQMYKKFAEMNNGVQSMSFFTFLNYQYDYAAEKKQYGKCNLISMLIQKELI